MATEGHSYSIFLVQFWNLSPGITICEKPIFALEMDAFGIGFGESQEVLVSTTIQFRKEKNLPVLSQRFETDGSCYPH